VVEGLVGGGDLLSDTAQVRWVAVADGDHPKANLESRERELLVRKGRGERLMGCDDTGPHGRRERQCDDRTRSECGKRQHVTALVPANRLNPERANPCKADEW
jgi:hypothetical protein